MFIEPISFSLDKRRPFLSSSARRRCRCRLINRAHILTVDEYARNPIPVRSPGHTGLSMAHRDRGANRVAVVLAYVDHGQLPERRHVQRFVEGALVDGAVAKETK